MENILSNEWTITVVGGIVVSLVVYYLFGVGKQKDKNIKNSSQIISNSNISARGDVVVGSKIINRKQENNKTNSLIKIDFHEQKVSWANYAIGRWVWSSFRMVLSINNYKNDSPEYVRVLLTAKSNDGIWKATNFVFQNTKNEMDSHPNEDYRVESKHKENVSVFISDYDIGHSEQRQMPDIDMDTLKLIIETEGGEKFTLPIKAGWISRG